MALTISDITVDLDTFKDANDLTVYTTNAVTYVTDSEYLLCIMGEDFALGYPENALGTPVTTGVDWILVPNSELAYGRMGMRVYRGVCISGSSQTTEITFPAEQKNCNAGVVGIANAGVIKNVTQSTDINTKAGSVTIPSVSAGSAAMAFYGSESSGTWAADSGETAMLSTVDVVGIFGTYNLALDNVMSAAYTSEDTSEFMLVVGFELPYLAATTPVIETVNGVGGTIADGEANVEIVGTVFNAASVNLVYISPTNVFDATGYTLTAVTGDTTELITIPEIDLPTSAVAGEPVYVFVHNGIELSDAFEISVTTSTASLHTLHLVTIDADAATVNVSAGLTVGDFYEILDPGTTTNWTAIGAASDTAGTRFDATGVGSGDGTVLALTDVIHETTLGFNVGMICAIYRVATPATPEYATSITSVSNLDTATIQLMVIYPNGPPVSGDKIHITYSATTGDIKSVTGQVALATGTLNTTQTEVC